MAKASERAKRLEEYKKPSSAVSRLIEEMGREGLFRCLMTIKLIVLQIHRFIR
jgi:hypothetical protein